MADINAVHLPSESIRFIEASEPNFHGCATLVNFSLVGANEKNIGLIVNGIPSAGVVFAPAQDQLWSGAAGKAFKVDAQGVRRPIACRPLPASGAVVLTSRSHNSPDALKQWMARFPEASLDFAGSSLKFCKLAEGAADLYPRFGPTCEWDTAAASAKNRLV